MVCLILQTILGRFRNIFETQQRSSRPPIVEHPCEAPARSCVGWSIPLPLALLPLDKLEPWMKIRSANQKQERFVRRNLRPSASVPRCLLGCKNDKTLTAVGRISLTACRAPERLERRCSMGGRALCTGAQSRHRCRGGAHTSNFPRADIPPRYSEDEATGVETKTGRSSRHAGGASISCMPCGARVYLCLLQGFLSTSDIRLPIRCRAHCQRASNDVYSFSFLCAWCDALL